jgi:hypothetical protein
MAYICRHCQVEIVKVNFSLGESWMHQREGASGHNGQYQFCRLTKAEPELPKVICMDLSIHDGHEWTFNHPANGLIDKLCWCEGRTVDERKRG